jgi:hypothetical protein
MEILTQKPQYKNPKAWQVAQDHIEQAKIALTQVFTSICMHDPKKGVTFI